MKNKYLLFPILFSIIAYSIVQIIGSVKAANSYSVIYTYSIIEMVFYLFMLIVSIFNIVLIFVRLKLKQNTFLVVSSIFSLCLMYFVRMLAQAILLFTVDGLSSNMQNEIALFVVIPIAIVTLIVSYTIYTIKVFRHRNLPVKAE